KSSCSEQGGKALDHVQHRFVHREGDETGLHYLERYNRAEDDHTVHGECDASIELLNHESHFQRFEGRFELYQDCDHHQSVAKAVDKDIVGRYEIRYGEGDAHEDPAHARRTDPAAGDVSSDQGGDLSRGDRI